MRRLARPTSVPPRRGSPRLRRLRRFAQRLALLAIVVGAPAWAWRSGVLDPAISAVARAHASLTSSVDLTLAELLVNGRKRTSRPEIQQALDIRRGDSLLGIDLEGARKRLEALPWIASAVVERRLPDTLYVAIVERRAVGRWRQGKRIMLVDRNGIPFAASKAESFRHLPLFTGKGAPDNAAALVDMMASRPALAKSVVRAARRGDRRWDLLFASGVVVRLPEKHPRRAWERLAFLDREYGLLDRGLVAIDMRLEDRLVLRTPAGAAPAVLGPGKNT